MRTIKHPRVNLSPGLLWALQQIVDYSRGPYNETDPELFTRLGTITLGILEREGFIIKDTRYEYLSTRLGDDIIDLCHTIANLIEETDETDK